MSPTVYVAYSRPDARAAAQLVRELGSHGVRGFLDTDDLALGSNWAGALQDAIRESAAVVVLVSPDALNSHTLLAGLGAARALKKPIIPVVVDGDLANLREAAPGFLLGLEWIDAIDRDFEQTGKRVRNFLTASDTSWGQAQGRETGTPAGTWLILAAGNLLPEKRRDECVGDALEVSYRRRQAGYGTLFQFLSSCATALRIVYAAARLRLHSMFVE